MRSRREPGTQSVPHCRDSRRSTARTGTRDRSTRDSRQRSSSPRHLQRCQRRCRDIAGSRRQRNGRGGQAPLVARQSHPRARRSWRTASSRMRPSGCACGDQRYQAWPAQQLDDHSQVRNLKIQRGMIRGGDRFRCSTATSGTLRIARDHRTARPEGAAT
jgi:hypothetical protein